MSDSDMARDAFSTFIPISVDSDARTKIIFDFFDLLAAIAAHGKTNGLGGRKLSRYAGWWAFEHSDTGNGFEASYKNWAVYVLMLSHRGLSKEKLTLTVPPMPRATFSLLTCVPCLPMYHAASLVSQPCQFPFNRWWRPQSIHQKLQRFSK